MVRVIIIIAVISTGLATRVSTPRFTRSTKMYSLKPQKQESFLQSQFTEKGFKKTENSEQNVVLLLFLFKLYKNLIVIITERSLDVFYTKL